MGFQQVLSAVLLRQSYSSSSWGFVYSRGCVVMRILTVTDFSLREDSGWCIKEREAAQPSTGSWSAGGHSRVERGRPERGGAKNDLSALSKLSSHNLLTEKAGGAVNPLCPRSMQRNGGAALRVHGSRRYSNGG